MFWIGLTSMKHICFDGPSTRRLHISCNWCKWNVSTTNDSRCCTKKDYRDGNKSRDWWCWVFYNTLLSSWRSTISFHVCQDWTTLDSRSHSMVRWVGTRRTCELNIVYMIPKIISNLDTIILAWHTDTIPFGWAPHIWRGPQWRAMSNWSRKEWFSHGQACWDTADDCYRNTSVFWWVF